ncbi:TetR/AcrR family transcriptional regulator [Gordonia aurantiaca]|uniref:TetR/AcrR family transcriptional regulator n=1 Tax=Gordonia sp. B21 TaxID=3151852 RepID=UPI00326627E5
MTSSSAPAKPMRADARRNYEKVVATASKAFRESGIDTPLDDIARRAGVGPGTLYRHFPTREALIAAAMRQDTAELVDSARAVDHTDPTRRLVDWIEKLARHVGAYQGLPEVLTSAGREPDGPLYTACAELRQATAEILAAAKESGDVREDLTGEEVSTLANMVAMGSGCVQARRLLELVVEGIRAR